MKSWLSGTIGLIITAIVLVLCFAFFAVRIATRSHPDPYTEEAGGVSETTKVYRNSFGIPHVTANNEDDLFFAQGYVTAQDRMWQMDLWRRTGRGRLSEIIGKDGVEVDVFMRAIDIAGIAARQWKSASPTTKRILTAYAAGVNAFLERSGGELPFEFDALGYQPEPWLPEDCLIVGRALSFELSLAFWSDLTFAQIAAQRGKTALKDYIPGLPSGPTVLDTAHVSSAMPDSVRTGLTPQQPTSSVLQSIHPDHDVISSLAERIRDVRERLGMTASSVGSNVWAVRTPVKSALVANDPHLSVSMPPKWYQIHLSCPGINVVGMSVPGLPLVFSGRNDSLAWGFTNVMVDDVDYVVETPDSTNGNYYLTATGRKRFQYRRDTIHVKDAPDSLVDLRATERGFVISDVHLLRNPTRLFGTTRRPSTNILTARCLTMRWTARATSDEVLAMYNINKAFRFSDVSQAVKTWHSPAFNFSVGTKSGLVATVIAGVAPIRATGDVSAFIDARNPQTDWKGTFHLSTLGTLVNPQRGWVASANNRTHSRAEPVISALYEPASRAIRIDELLRVYRDHSVRDAQVMQQDVVSPSARTTVVACLSDLQRGTSRYGTVEKEALRLLKSWDGTQASIDPAAAIYAVFWQRLLHNTFEDELGSQLYADYMFVTSIPTRRMEELVRQPNHILFDDIRTPQRETMSWIVVRSFIEAIRELRTTFQSDQPQQWKFGALHTITFQHQFGAHPLMAPVMNQGPYEMGGSNTTINNTEWKLWSPYSVRVHASMRVISDMADSIQFSVVPGGVSGQPLNAHYADQMQLWLKGGYVRLPVRATPDVGFRLYHVFKPS